MPLRLLSRKPRNVEPAPPPPPKPAPKRPVRTTTYEPAPVESFDSDELVRALQCRRWGFVADQAGHWQKHARGAEALRRAIDGIDEEFALVPEGSAAITTTLSDAAGAPEADQPVPAFLLARYPVTQGEYQRFVDCGGYEDLDLWPQEVWPHLIDFKDLTDMAGPRFWQRGRHDARHSRHPVVGICFYEAEAFARWAGFRLPTEAEWQLAASWRITSSAHVMRRYPWGDALDRSRCNIWASAVGNTVPVEHHEEGAAPNGVRQLIGNVWEWTATDFEVSDEDGRPVVGDMLMKGIRGGAFDTYFPSQATSNFRTGQPCLIRANNTGFRCALDVRS